MAEYINKAVIQLNNKVIYIYILRSGTILKQSNLYHILFRVHRLHVYKVMLIYDHAGCLLYGSALMQRLLNG